jgi:hypothetical protein
MAWTPKPNRDKNAVVSAAELAQFRKEYGADKTLRDLLNADKGLVRKGSSAADVRARGGDAAGKVGGTYESKSGGSKKADIPTGDEKAPKASGKDTSGPSNIERVLMGIGGGGAAYGAYRGGRALFSAPKGGVSRAEAAIERFVGGRRAPKAAAERADPRVGRPVTTRLDDAAAAFSKPRAAEMSKETGRKFTAAQEREAAEAAVRGAAARKKMAETRAGRSRAMEEAKKESMMRADKKKPSPRSRTRDKEDIEFAKGGYAAKGKK